MNQVRVFAFIDSQNLNLGVRDMGWKLDFQKFRKYLTDKYHVSSALLFLGYVKSNQHLYDHLTESGYKLIFKHTVKTRYGIKGNVDAELIVYALTHVYEKICDKVIVVSGDGDFAILAEFLLKKDALSAFIVPNKQTVSILIKKVFVKYQCLNLLESLNNRKDSLEKKEPLYRSGNR